VVQSLGIEIIMFGYMRRVMDLVAGIGMFVMQEGLVQNTEVVVKNM
jgi:hypothetical protein